MYGDHFGQLFAAAFGICLAIGVVLGALAVGIAYLIYLAFTHISIAVV